MQLVLLLLYPLSVHLAVVMHAPIMQIIAIIALAAGLLYIGLRERSRLAWCVFIVVSLVSAVAAYLNIAIYALYLPPVVIPLLFLSVFFRSLLSGQTPLVTAIAEKARGVLTEDIRLYTRHVTVFWVVVLGFISIVSAILPWLASDVVWSLFTSFISYAVIALLFVAEYLYRRIRFQGHKHPKFIQYLRIVLDAKIRKA